MKKAIEIVKIKQVTRDCEIFQERVYSSVKIVEKEIGNDTQESFVLLC